MVGSRGSRRREQDEVRAMGRVMREGVWRQIRVAGVLLGERVRVKA